MREITRRCLSVLMACAIVTTGTIAFVNLDQGPEPVQKYGGVEEGKAVAPIIAGAIAIGIGAAKTAQVADEYFNDDVNQSKLTTADSKETKTNIHSQAAADANSGKRFQQTVNNWMEDGSTIGRLEGQNAYIRALENGSSLPDKAIVKGDSVTKTNEWFAERQVRIVRAYEKQVITVRHLLDAAYHGGYDPDQDWTTSSGYDGPSTTNTSTTLANGSTIGFETLVWADSSLNGPTVNPFTQSLGGYDNETLFKVPPNSDLSQFEYLDPYDWWKAWNKTEQERQSSVNQVQNFVDGTYSGYSQGDLDTSDLVTPSLAERNYDSYGDTGTYTLNSLTKMGYSVPTDFSSTKTMKLEADGSKRTGLLLSDGTPAGGQFEIGKEYNVSNIAGKQLVQTSSELLEIENNVTVLSVNQTDGSVKSSGSVAYDNPGYSSATSIDEYRNQMQNLSQQLAEINARQDRLRNGTGSGGIGLPSLGGLSSTAVLVIALLGALLLFGRD